MRFMHSERAKYASTFLTILTLVYLMFPLSGSLNSEDSRILNQSLMLSETYQNPNHMNYVPEGKVVGEKINTNEGFAYLWFTLEKNSTIVESRVISFSPPMKRVELWEIKGGKYMRIGKSGILEDEKSSVVKSTDYSFKLDIDSDKNNFLAIVSSPFPISPRPTIRSEKDFFLYHTQAVTIYSNYIGILCAVLLINLVLFYWTGIKIYFAYSALIGFSHLFGVLSIYGFIDYYFFNDGSQLALNSILVGVSLMVSTGVFFCNTYFNTKLNYPRYHKIGLFFIYSSAVASFASLFYVSTELQNFVDVLSIFAMTYILCICWKHRKKDRFGSYYFFLAYGSFCVGSYVYILRDQGYLPDTPMLRSSLLIGSTIESLLFCVHLAVKFNEVRSDLKQAHNELVEKNNLLIDINKTLEQRVLKKTRDIQSIMSHAPIGIVMLSETLLLEKPYSVQLTKIFEKHKIDNACFISILDDYFILTKQELDRIGDVVRTSIGVDSLNFEANASHLPIELQSKDRRYFRFTWSYVEDNLSEVVKVIVTIDETTEIKTKESALKKSSQEMTIVEELLRNNELAIVSFFESLTRYLAHNNEIFSKELKDKISTAYANLHTAKGSAGILQLKELSSTIHNVEQSLAEARISDDVDFSVLKMKQEKLQKVFDNYINVYTTKIGRSLVPELRISTKTADYIYDYVKKLSEVDTYILSNVSVDLKVFAESLLSDRYRLAKDLDKPIPNAIIKAKGFINHSTSKFISGIFSHLLRNSMDHGIEHSNNRLEKGKKKIATLTLFMNFEDGFYDIDFWDDGAGLNLAKIYDAAIEKKLIVPKQNVSDSFLANLIFDEGFSTANSVTDISGRGVGMGAVKAFVEESGGSLELALGERKGDFISFVVRLKIPDQYVFESNTDKAV